MKKYGLVGYPLSHSFSKKFWTEKFVREGIDSCYENFEIDSISRFPEIFRDNPEIAGLNVTIPYKQQVMAYLDEMDEAAAEVGAVNTVRIIHRDNRVVLKGYNSDIAGFEKTLTPLLKPFHTKALILGTGGASKAIKYVLRKLGIEFISASIEELNEGEISYSQIDQAMMEERLLIINATPLGTFPKIETCPDIPYRFITDRHLLYDLVYNPETTRFMALGIEKGATVKNGYDMLIGQALRSYEIWNTKEG